MYFSDSYFFLIKLKKPIKIKKEKGKAPTFSNFDFDWLFDFD